MKNYPKANFAVSLLIAPALALAVIFCAPQFAGASSCAGSPPAGERRVNIIYTNDTHSHLEPFDVAELGADFGGVERRAEFVAAARRSCPRTLVLDAGDFCQETPYFTFFKGEADAKIVSLIGYDALTVGNHEFDAGLDRLLKNIADYRLPVTCCNVFYQDGRPVFTPFFIFRKGGVRIAVIGLMGQGAWSVIPKKFREGLFCADATAMARGLVRFLRPSADVVVILSHSGNADDLQMAKAVPGADVIVGGHSHSLVREAVLVPNGSSGGPGGTIVTQDFKWGAQAGNLEIRIGDDGKIRRYANSFVPMDKKIRVRRGSRVKKALDVYRAEIGQKIREKIGSCPAGMPYNEIEASKAEFSLGTFICSVMKETAGADVAFINASGIRSGLPAGDITVEDVMKVVPFDNSVVSCEMKGEALAAMFARLASGPGGESGLQLAGATFAVDKVAKTVSGLKVGGGPVDPARTYRLATISYLAEGNLNGAELLRGASNFSDSGVFIRDAMIKKIRELKVVEPPAPSNFTIR